MADKKINDLILASNLQDTMQFETDIGGVTANKVTYSQISDDVLGKVTDRDNAFSVKQTYASHPTIDSDTDIIDKKYADDTFEPVITKGDLTESGSSVLTISGGTNAVIGGGTSIEVNEANSTTSGYITSADWNTFNNKQDQITFPISISQGGTNSSTAITDDRIVVTSAGKIVSGTTTTNEVGLLNGMTSVTTGTANNDKLVTQGYVDDNNTYAGLSDVNAPYTSSGAITAVNATKDGMTELGVIVGEPATNEFTITKGSSVLDVSASSTINQDLSSTSSPTFSNVTLSSISDGVVKSTSGVLSGGNSIDLTSDVSGILPQANGGSGIDSSGVTNGQLLIGGTTNHDFKLGAITAGSGISISNGENSITISASTGSSTYSGLSDVNAPYAIAGALTRVNDSTDGMTESSTALSEPASNQFRLTRGSTIVTASSSCDIDQNLSTTSSVNHAGITASSNINTTGGVFQINGTDINTTGTLTNVAYKGQDNIFTLKQTYSSHPTFSSDTDIIDKKYADDTFEPALTKGDLTEATSSVLTITGGTGSIIGSGVTIEVDQADSANDGYLSSTDWNTFNNKEDSLTKGNLTETTSSVLTITGGTGSVIGSGVTIEVDQADASNDGYLSSADWNTFNNKQDSLTFPLGLNLGGTGIDASSVTDGQLLIGGSTSNDLQLATLTAGSGITITNGNNAITISSTTGSSTYAGLSDVNAPYNNVGALPFVNSTSDGMDESTTILSEPAANQFRITRGSTVLTASSSCDIDQNLSTTSDVSHNKITANDHFVGSNRLAVSSSPDIVTIGSYHCDYSTIASAFAGESGIKEYRLEIGTYSEDLNASNESMSKYIGDTSTINGRVNLTAGAYANIFACSLSGTYGITSPSTSGEIYFRSINVNSNSVTSGTLFSGGTSNINISEIKHIETDSKVVIGSTSTVSSANVILDASYSELSCTSDNSYFINTKADNALYTADVHRITGTADATYNNYLVNSEANSESSILSNYVTGIDNLINQSDGNIYISSNKLDGDITITGGSSYVTAGEYTGAISVSGSASHLHGNLNSLTGNINISADSGVTSFINSSYFSGTVTRSYASNLVGILGTDSGIECYTGSNRLKLMSRGATYSGGGIEFQGSMDNSYLPWYLDVGGNNIRLYCNVDDSGYDFKVYNDYSGRTARIYTDSLASSNGTVYANSGYLTLTNPSDEKLKEDITMYSDNEILDKVSKMNVYRYKYKLNGVDGFGFIAQHIQEIFPDAVQSELMPVEYIDGDEHNTRLEECLGINDRLNVYHFATTIALVNLTKKLESRIADLEKKLAS